MKCPKCRFVQRDGPSECGRCGLIFANWNSQREAVAQTTTEEPPFINLKSAAAILFFVAVIGVGSFVFRSPTSAGKVSPDERPAERELSAQTESLYRRGEDAYTRGDYEQCVKHLSDAIELQEDFLEAYYGRGGCSIGLALHVMREGNRERALELYRDSVADKREAKALMDEGRWYIYFGKREQRQMISDVKSALVDADEVMADEESLVAAMKLMAVGR
ncbi:MAG: hypothetical protein IT290_08725 [Deltaproteobacteria bacterium]|nr:hypothetical protein [Deltaproteobacteria bacterium]